MKNLTILKIILQFCQNIWVLELVINIQKKKKAIEENEVTPGQRKTHTNNEVLVSLV